MNDLLVKPLLNNEIKVDVDDVSLGMYVTALDIPWEQSRFIFKGFLLEEDKELKEIRRVCKYIILDKDRSINVSFEQIAPPQTKNKPVAQGDLLQQFLASEAKNGKPLPAPAKAAEVAKPIKTADVPAKPTGTLASTLHAEAAAPTQENKAAEIVLPAVKPRLFRSIISPLVDLISGKPKIKENFNPHKIHQSKKHLNTSVKEDMLRMQFAKDLRDQFEFSNSPISDKMSNYVTTASLAQEVPMAKEAQSNFMDVAQCTLALDMNDSSLHESVNVAKDAVADVVDSITCNPEAMQLVNNIRKLDEHSYQHAIDVSLLMVALGREMCLFTDDLVEVGLGGMLHDCGEVKPKGVSKINSIKNITNITKFRVYKDDHVQIGMDIVKRTNQSRIVREIVANHHEHFDGSGYPNGKKGGQIGLYGNMICIVDTYVSLINGRNCEVALPPNKALDFMYKQKGRLFHPQMLDQFI